jgi:hypothetical protein
MTAVNEHQSQVSVRVVDRVERRRSSMAAAAEAEALRGSTV